NGRVVSRPLPSSLSPARRSPDRPLILAHRGGRALGPENTIPAFDLGLAAGADGLELDVHVSADDVAVVCHDATLDRTTDATGPIAARTAAELAALDATRRYGVDLEHVWTGPRAGIPTLEEVLRRYPDVPVVIEMKAASRRAAEAVVRAVRATGAAGRVGGGAGRARRHAGLRRRRGARLDRAARGHPDARGGVAALSGRAGRDRDEGRLAARGGGGRAGRARHRRRRPRVRRVVQPRRAAR